MKSFGYLGWIILALIVGFGSFIGASLFAYILLQRMSLKALVTNQPVDVTITDPVLAYAQALDPLQVSIRQSVHTSVTVNQEFVLPVTDTLHILAHFDGEIPVDTQVRFKQDIPLDQDLDCDAVIELEAFGERIFLPLQGKFHVKTLVPVDMMIPLKQVLKAKFTAPVDAVLKQPLRVPLKMAIDGNIPLSADLNVPVKDAFAARVQFPTDTPMKASIDYADLQLPLGTVALDFGQR